MWSPADMITKKQIDDLKTRSDSCMIRMEAQKKKNAACRSRHAEMIKGIKDRLEKKKKEKPS